MIENSSERSALLRACFSFLVPVARFLLRSGISYNEFAEIARVAFVRVGSEDYGIRGRPTNSSRIAAMTGIPRREVTRVRQLVKAYDADPRINLSPMGDVLHHWFTDPAFVDNRGKPRILRFSGNPISFESLVNRVASDVPAGAMRVELARCGAITVLETGELVAIKRHAVPNEFDEKLVTSISFNLRGIASTIAHNSNPNRGKDSGWIERFIQSRGLSKPQRAEIRLDLRKRITEFSEAIDDRFSSVDGLSDDTAGRVGVGVYYYEDE